MRIAVPRDRTIDRSPGRCYYRFLQVMSSTPHLAIEQGPEKGRQITVPPDGARLGRSSKNDIVVIDPMLSRHHCRLFFKPEEGLWITDLGSANQTLVNDKPVQETPLNVGDSITIGDTVFKVLNNGAPPGAKRAALTPSSPVIDLGLKSTTEHASPKSIGFKPILSTAIVALTLVAGAWAIKKFVINSPKGNGSTVRIPVDNTLEIDYEKVEADQKNIFRYHFNLTKDNTVTIQITDLQNNVIPPKRQKVRAEMVEDLAQFIRNSGFFELEEQHKGTQPNLYHCMKLSITLGKQTRTVIVENHSEPAVFKDVRQKVEVFGNNNLKMWFRAQPPEKLLEMAQQTFLLGKKLRDEREIQYGNLAAAISSFEESERYLDASQNKPDYYPELLALLSDSKEELTKRYEDQNFRAERAMNNGHWEDSARELRILLEIIPDSADDRHEETRKKLLQVESQLHLGE
jgi:pSer/pThr/pTyr-binding forkhead associated (FHA) protein